MAGNYFTTSYIHRYCQYIRGFLGGGPGTSPATRHIGGGSSYQSSYPANGGGLLSPTQLPGKWGFPATNPATRQGH